MGQVVGYKIDHQRFVPGFHNAFLFGANGKLESATGLVSPTQRI